MTAEPGEEGRGTTTVVPWRLRRLYELWRCDGGVAECDLAAAANPASCSGEGLGILVVAAARCGLGGRASTVDVSSAAVISAAAVAAAAAAAIAAAVAPGFAASAANSFAMAAACSACLI